MLAGSVVELGGHLAAWEPAALWAANDVGHWPSLTLGVSRPIEASLPPPKLWKQSVFNCNQQYLGNCWFSSRAVGEASNYESSSSIQVSAAGDNAPLQFSLSTGNANKHSFVSGTNAPDNALIRESICGLPARSGFP